MKKKEVPFKIILDDGKAEYTCRANPCTLAIYGAEAYEKALTDLISSILSPLGYMASLENLYALQGYSREELEEDIRTARFEAYLSNIIDMTLLERLDDNE